MAKTRKGFDVVIRAFIPFDPEYLFANGEDPHTTDPKAAIADVEKLMADRGFTDLRRKIDYRKRRRLPEDGGSDGPR
jgi:hypothetical protein